MEFLEKVAVGLAKGIENDPYCDQEKSPTNWHAVIDGLQGKGDPATLKANLLASGARDPLIGLPKRTRGWALRFRRRKSKAACALSCKNPWNRSRGVRRAFLPSFSSAWSS